MKDTSEKDQFLVIRKGTGEDEGKAALFLKLPGKNKEKRLLEHVYCRSSLMGYFSVTMRSVYLLHTLHCMSENHKVIFLIEFTVFC